MGSEIEKQFTDNLKAGDAIKINRSSIASITESLGETDELRARELAKAWNLKRSINMLCILSIVTTILAISQILAFIRTGERLFVLTTCENLILRISFIGVIVLVCMKDMNQIVINMQVKITGSMMKPENSAFLMFTYFIRMAGELLAVYTICFMVVTAPKDDDESVVD